MENLCTHNYICMCVYLNVSLEAAESLSLVSVWYLLCHIGYERYKYANLIDNDFVFIV